MVSRWGCTGSWTRCWRAGGRDWDLACRLLDRTREAEDGACEGVDLVDDPASLSTLHEVTLTNPAPRLSWLGDSNLSRTRSVTNSLLYPLPSPVLIIVIPELDNFSKVVKAVPKVVLVIVSLSRMSWTQILT